jgi:hypothetical protein
MNNLAQQTGGEAIVAKNDIAGALQRSIEDGSNYYTLAYIPQNKTWNGKFRKIGVELAEKNDLADYRRGYFAIEDKGSGSPAQELNQALQPETPDSTMLALDSKAQPPDPQHPALRIDSRLDARNLAFSTTSDGHHRAQLLVLLIALNDGPSLPAAPPQSSGNLSLDFTDEQYRLALTSGIPFHQELALKPGKYRLRLGVIDVMNHRIGTLEMPLNLASGQ